MSLNRTKSNIIRNKTTGAMILMASVMIARGSSFLFSKWLMEDLAPVNILAVRFTIAFVILCVIFYKKIINIDKVTLIKGLKLGIAYTACMIVEMYGLRLIDAGTSAFIENSAILIVPIYMSVLTRTLPRAKVMRCALIAVIGIGFLTISGGIKFNIGIVYAIIAALIFGGCIIITDDVTKEGDPISMGIMQIGFMGLFSIIYSFIFEKPVLPQNGVQWGMILMLALVCSCFGFTFQPLAQKYISPETAGVFTAVNPLTTCILGLILHEEQFGLFKLAGGALIVAAVLLSIRSENQDSNSSCNEGSIGSKNKNYSQQRRLPRIGMRIIKSAVGVLICFLIDMLRGNSGIVFYSLLAVLWCIRDYVSETKKFAIQRTIGTVIGAIFGLLVLVANRFLINASELSGGFTRAVCDFLTGRIGYSIVVSAVIVLVLYSTVLVKQKQASYFSCVVFLSIVINHIADMNPYIFVWNRFLDTMIGILVGVSVNCFVIRRHRNRNVLFLSGLDDTLLSSNGIMSDYSRVELNRMIDSGVKFTVSTIRTPASLLEPLRGINLTLPVIAMDGAALYDITENRYEKVYVIASEHSNKVRDFLKENNISYFANVVVEDVLLIYYMDSENEYYNKLMSILRRSPYRNYIKRNVPADENVVYYTVIDECDKIDAIYEIILHNPAFNNLKVIVTPSVDIKGCSVLKIYNKNASKENMLDYLKEHLSIEETVSFGTVEGKYTHVIAPGDFDRVVKLMKKEI